MIVSHPEYLSVLRHVAFRRRVRCQQFSVSRNVAAAPAARAGRDRSSAAMAHAMPRERAAASIKSQGKKMMQSGMLEKLDEFPLIS